MTDLSVSMTSPPKDSSPNIDDAILEARARLLARTPIPPKPEGTEEFLSFRLARETYGIPASFVFAVFKLQDVTPLPGAEPPLYGVTAWRGDVLTVLDLRRSFGASTTALDDLARVIVLGERRPVFGILADELGSTVSIVPTDIFSLTDDQSRQRDYLRGTTRDAMLILDVPQLIRRQTDLS